MNTPKLFLHVGPPRSATTSLQIALQKADCDALHYGGTFQPRKNNAGSLAETLYGAAAGHLAADDFEVRNALNEIHRHVREEARAVVISEESFLIEGVQNPFTSKLLRLGELLSSIPTVVLITLRDPNDALPSLYQTLFNSLPLHEKLSFTRFCRGPRARCYDYTFVQKALGRAGFQDVRGIDFTDLTGGEVPLQHIIGDFESTKAHLVLGHANASAKLEGEKRVPPQVSLRLIGAYPTMRAILDWTGLRGTALHRDVACAFSRIKFSPCGASHFRVPKDIAADFSRSFISTRAHLMSLKSDE